LNCETSNEAFFKALKDNHTKLIKSGAERWNEWRTKFPREHVRLDDVNFSGMDLTNIRLEGDVIKYQIVREGVKQDEFECRRATVSFVRSNLSDTRLCSAHIREVNFYGADLQRANFSNANSGQAKYGSAKLQNSIFYNANLEGAVFTSASLQNTSFNQVNLQHANFSFANLQDARFSGSNLKHTNLKAANLQGADLRGANNFRLDACFIKDAKFEPKSKDPWSVLRRTYTGPKLIYVMLGLVAFALPYIAKVGLWSLINRVQKYTSESDKFLGSRIKAQEISGALLSKVDVSTDNITAVTRCLSDNCTAYPVWKLIFAVDQDPLVLGFISVPLWFLTVTMISYNLLRGVLTYLIATMRDEEERSGFSPAWSKKKIKQNKYVEPKPYEIEWWFGYQWLYYAHVFVTLLGCIAILAFMINGWCWLSQPIYLPA